MTKRRVSKICTLCLIVGLMTNVITPTSAYAMANDIQDDVTTTYLIADSENPITDELIQDKNDFAVNNEKFLALQEEMKAQGYELEEVQVTDVIEENGMCTYDTGSTYVYDTGKVVTYYWQHSYDDTKHMADCAPLDFARFVDLALTTAVGVATPPLVWIPFSLFFGTTCHDSTEYLFYRNTASELISHKQTTFSRVGYYKEGSSYYWGYEAKCIAFAGTISETWFNSAHAPRSDTKSYNFSYASPNYYQSDYVILALAQRSKDTGVDEEWYTLPAELKVQ